MFKDGAKHGAAQLPGVKSRKKRSPIFSHDELRRSDKHDVLHLLSQAAFHASIGLRRYTLAVAVHAVRPAAPRMEIDGKTTT